MVRSSYSPSARRRRRIRRKEYWQPKLLQQAMAATKSWSDALETGDGFDMLGERQQIECGECGQA